MPYYNRDPTQDQNFDNRPNRGYLEITRPDSLLTTSKQGCRVAGLQFRGAPVRSVLPNAGKCFIVAATCRQNFRLSLLRLHVLGWMVVKDVLKVRLKDHI